MNQQQNAISLARVSLVSLTGESRKMKARSILMCIMLLICLLPLSLHSYGIFWRKQAQGFDPHLCCRTGFDGNYDFTGTLSDLDKVLTNGANLLRDTIQFAILDHELEDGSLILLKSNRDTCGLTYLLRNGPHYSRIVGVLKQAPDSINNDTLEWNVSRDSIGIDAKIYAADEGGVFRYIPQTTKLQSFDEDAFQNAPTGSLKQAIYTINKSRHNYVENSVRNDSILQAELMCSNRAYIPFIGKCPNDKPVVKRTPDNSGTYYLDSPQDVYILKPMLYLYPSSATNYVITADSNIPIISSYPRIVNRKWEVRAYPDGKLIDPKTHKEYYGIFWEGGNFSHSEFDSGLIVKPIDFPDKFDSLLVLKGLNYRERQEFITFWMNRFINYEWVLIQFIDEQFSFHNQIDITPRPIEFIRVSAIFSQVNEFRIIPPQNIKPKYRDPHAAIEWGGVILDQASYK